MRLLTEASTIVCDHGAPVTNRASQRWVTIGGTPVLVVPDPQGRTVTGCPNTNPTGGQKACTTTFQVQSGASAYVRIDGHPVCLDTLKGKTDGTPPMLYSYEVRSPRQDYVSSDG